MRGSEGEGREAGRQGRARVDLRPRSGRVHSAGAPLDLLLQVLDLAGQLQDSVDSRD